MQIIFLSSADFNFCSVATASRADNSVHARNFAEFKVANDKSIAVDVEVGAADGKSGPISKLHFAVQIKLTYLFLTLSS